MNDGCGVELGKWVGRREAFGLVAGRCAAADVESLQSIRDGRLYEKLGVSWDEFCARYLHIPRRTVEREIGYLRRFGPEFFTLRQLARLNVREYAEIAEQISVEGVRVDGRIVPLLPENSEAVAEAVETLLARRAVAASNPPATAGVDAALRDLRRSAQRLRAFENTLDAEQTRALATELLDILSAAAACGVAIGPGQ
jgi:hypothetical protein